MNSPKEKGYTSISKVRPVNNVAKSLLSRKALEPVQRTIDGLDRLVSSSCTINPSGRADYTVAFSTKGDTETGTRETIRILYEALDNVPVPDGAVLRVPVLVKGVKTPGRP